jgi:hypothetical protein
MVSSGVLEIHYSRIKLRYARRARTTSTGPRATVTSQYERMLRYLQVDMYASAFVVDIRVCSTKQSIIT